MGVAGVGNVMSGWHVGSWGPCQPFVLLCHLGLLSFCNPGPFRVLCELVGPDRKEACVSRAGSRQAVPQIHCVRVR